MKLGRLQRITLDDIKTYPDEVVRKYNENLERLELALDSNLDASNFAGRTIQVEALNGVAQFVSHPGAISGVTFKKMLPQPFLPGSFSTPIAHWYPANNGFYVVVNWTVPEGQPLVQKASIAVFVETL